MVMNDETWHIIRNTTGVTGFVGPGSRPVPLTDEEVERMGVEIRTIEIKFAVGDSVRIIDGPLSGFIGIVEEISEDLKNVKVSAGAGFIVVLTGDILTMPGLPKAPAAERIDVDENGKISGLF